MKFTDEQDAVIASGRQGKSFTVRAYAGCGKTATLVQTAKNIKGRGLYIAFNKANALEAKAKFKGFSDAATVHSLAYQALGYQYKDRIEGDEAGKLSAYRLLTHYNYAKLGPITALGRATLVRICLNNWMNSADPEPIDKHVDTDHALLAAEAAGQRLSNKQLLCEVIVADTRRLVADLVVNEALPMPFDFFLKLWVLSDPVLPYDYLLFDEAQDANELFCHLVLSQPMQKILVGDPYQSIYGFRGAVNVLDDLDFPSLFLSQSFRFGQVIADYANTILKPLGATVPVKGFDTDRSSLGNRAALLYRGNTSIFTELLAKVLKEKKKVAVVGGTKDMAQILKAVELLKEGKETPHPDFAGFKDWSEYCDAASIPGAPDEMTRLVGLCNRTPIKALRYALQLTDRVKEDKADIVMSTAHKSKGREWPYVALGEDFYLPEPGVDLDLEESRLNYVAATRAQVDMVGHDEMMEAYRQAYRAQQGITGSASGDAIDRIIFELRGKDKAHRDRVLNELSAPVKRKLYERLSN